MPATVAEVSRLQEYLRGVLERAEHHAQGVDEIALAVLGGVLWKADGDLEVLERDGDMKNVLWMRVGGQRFALSYRHANQTIELRHGNTRGSVLASFSNDTPLEEVKRVFASL